jgi:large subunit ribosomal protein L5e
MGYIKVLKNKAYSMRYQTKFRRRREGKTDYYARKRLVFQEKDKYDSRKYRLCVRRTNKRIITQVIYATLTGDRVMCAADSAELKNHGLNAGLTNYAAAYCTGLLCARRLLASKQMDKMFVGKEKADGAHFCTADVDSDRRPFKCFLDVGLVRTTTGNRVFGAMKGAVDGGLNIPHKDKRFPGTHITKAELVTNKRGKASEIEKAKQTFDPKEHREHIFGGHVETYYKSLKGENPQKFAKQFSRWEKALGNQSFADLYKKVHASIRAKPAAKHATSAKVRRAEAAKKGGRVIKEAKAGYNIRQGNTKSKNAQKHAFIQYRRLTHTERKARVAAKMQIIMENN